MCNRYHIFVSQYGVQTLMIPGNEYAEIRRNWPDHVAGPWAVVPFINMV